MSEDEYDYFSYFSGYVPPGIIFQVSADDIVRIAERSCEDEYSTVNSLCLIGLSSYFEAFAKDHLASVLSLAPELIETLQAAGHPTDIPAEEALEFRDDLQYTVGFLIAQRLDFGSAKKINAFFTALLKITPFGKKDMASYERLLRDRNLLVHHGGTYTTKYIRQAYGEIPGERRRAHVDSLEITTQRIAEDASFLKRIARNLIDSSADSLDSFLKQERGEFSEETSKTLHAMKWWEDREEA